MSHCPHSAVLGKYTSQSLPPFPLSSFPPSHLSFLIEQVLMERLVSAGSSSGSSDLQAPCPPRAPTPTHLPSPLVLLGLLAAPWPGSLLPSDSISSVLCPPNLRLGLASRERNQTVRL